MARPLVAEGHQVVEKLAGLADDLGSGFAGGDSAGVFIILRTTPAEGPVHRNESEPGCSTADRTSKPDHPAAAGGLQCRRRAWSKYFSFFGQGNRGSVPSVTYCPTLDASLEMQITQLVRELEPAGRKTIPACRSEASQVVDGPAAWQHPACISLRGRIGRETIFLNRC